MGMLFGALFLSGIVRIVMQALKCLYLMKRSEVMGFLGALGWVLFAFVLGFIVGIGIGATAAKNGQKTRNSDSDRKVAEK